MQTIVFFAVNPYLANSINAYGNFMVSLLSPSVMTLAILIVSCVFFMSGKVRSDIVALCALLALLIFGILTPAEALSGFASPVVIMMVGLFVVGAGIFRTGLAKMISSRILRIGGKNENVLFVLVMLVTALIGAFVSNTGTVAVMLPIVMSMAASSGISSSRYLMPMAFASSMGEEGVPLPERRHQRPHVRTGRRCRGSRRTDEGPLRRLVQPTSAHNNNGCEKGSEP